MNAHVHYGSAHCPPSCQQGQFDRARADAHETHRDGLGNAYWHKFVLDDGSVLRVVSYVDALYRLRDEWLADGTRQRTYDDVVGVFLTPGGEDADVS